jgi:hypothetical protein
MISDMARNYPLTLAAWLMLCLPFAACLNNNTDCVQSNNCQTTAPTDAGLYLKVTIDAENPAVPVAVYYGNVSDSNLYFQDTLTGSITYSVSLDSKFSATAKYRQGAITVIAIDGDRTKLKTTNSCGDTCYDVKDASLDLRLKK